MWPRFAGRDEARVHAAAVARERVGQHDDHLASTRRDRVIGDLIKQVTHFKSGGGNPICVAFVGINFAEQYVSFEGRKKWATDGKRYKHPIQEAAQAEQRLADKARSAFDEFQFLRFRATNMKPFPFEWVDLATTELEYSSVLTRISREYDRQFA